MENPKERIEDILKRNPYLDAKVGLGYDNFLDFTCGRQFYVDKTHFISEWMRSDAKVTLITRPRRFGKTTLFSTVETFLIQSMRSTRNILKNFAFGKIKRVGKCSGRFRLFRSVLEAARV